MPDDAKLAATRRRAELFTHGGSQAVRLPKDGQAMARGWAIATANVHEFGRVQGLQVIDWTAPTGAP
ncbi:MAG TPA: hypothetical protein VN694_13895 [Caulobacteraceae bacterium]|nr:hypothetical protein [Caulobacteraceae bacterium]